MSIYEQVMENKEHKKEFEKERKRLSKFYSEKYIPTHMVDRAVIVVKKKRPFIDWIRKLPDLDLEITLKSINEDPSTYLVPSCEDDVGQLAYLSLICHEIFAIEMSGWWTEESAWEKDLSFENFNRWFDYEISSMPIDLGEDEIFREEY